MLTSEAEYRADLAELRAKRGKTHIDPGINVTVVTCDDTMLWMTLKDGRVVGAPISWFPRLHEATSQQRENWVIMPAGHGVHWPDVDEHISARVLMGHPS